MSTIYAEAVPQEKKNFITSFYKASDGRDNEAYLSFLTDDVNFIMGPSQNSGADAVRKLRESMWNGVDSRHHVPKKVFAFDSSANELMLNGVLTYGLKNGTFVRDVPWAANMVFASGDKRKLAKYQVFIDGGAMKEALRQQAEESK